MAPNVLLIVLDTARADALEPYGTPPGGTPALADLARRGRALHGVHATACWTLPSHASMFTGLMPRAAGLSKAPGETVAGSRPVLEGLAHRLLPGVLKRAGYRTRGVSANIAVSNASGFATGFDEFVDVPPTRVPDLVSTGPGGRLRWGFDALRARSDDGAAAVGRILRDWFAQPGETPEFWFVNLIECHSPYLPPKPWNDLGALDRVRAAEEARRHLTFGEILRVCVDQFDVPPAALARMRHLYARAVRQLDDWVADALGALDAIGKLDDTLVLVCSDHGENLGDGNLLGHAYSLDQRLLNVPLIASGPGAPAEMTSLVEMPRAIADAVGLDDHPWPREPLDAAVAQFDPPGKLDDPRKVRAVEEWGAGPEVLEALSTPIDAAVKGRTKLVRRGTRFELFDLAADPSEGNAIGVSREDAPRELVEAIESHQSGPLAPVPATAEPRLAADELERIEQQMRTLGYL